MKPPFDVLRANLEKSLNNLDQSLNGVEWCDKAIDVIQESILQIRVLETTFITGRDSEIEFFRDVCPVFYGKLLLYMRLHQFERCRLPLPDRALPILMEREQQRVASFFGTHWKFWTYYLIGSALLDSQFTRVFDQTDIFEPLTLLIDPKGPTVASYRVAWCLAMKDYGAWLAQERERSLDLSVDRYWRDYTGALEATDFSEWKDLL